VDIRPWRAIVVSGGRAQWHVSPVQKHYVRCEIHAGEVSIEEALRAHRALTSAVACSPEPSVAVITDGADPKPTIVLPGFAHNVGPEPVDVGSSRHAAISSRCLHGRTYRD
jgi:hypothetical protein